MSSLQVQFCLLTIRALTEKRCKKKMGGRVVTEYLLESDLQLKKPLTSPLILSSCCHPLNTLREDTQCLNNSHCWRQTMQKNTGLNQIVNCARC